MHIKLCGVESWPLQMAQAWDGTGLEGSAEQMERFEANGTYSTVIWKIWEREPRRYPAT